MQLQNITLYFKQTLQHHAIFIPVSKQSYTSMLSVYFTHLHQQWRRDKHRIHEEEGLRFNGWSWTDFRRGIPPSSQFCDGILALYPPLKPSVMSFQSVATGFFTLQFRKVQRMSTNVRVIKRGFSPNVGNFCPQSCYVTSWVPRRWARKRGLDIPWQVRDYYANVNKATWSGWTTVFILTTDWAMWWPGCGGLCHHTQGLAIGPNQLVSGAINSRFKLNIKII